MEIINNSRRAHIFVIVLNILFLYLSISFIPAYAKQLESGAKVSTLANIPEKTHIRIYGYTAPASIVQVNSVRVFGQTNSDRLGYFVFEDLPISNEAREICLTTLDTEKRVGFPLCIPLPDVDKPTEIGPLLLSPTLSISTARLVQNDQAFASGRTIPNQDVIISFFQENQRNPKEIKVVQILNRFLDITAYANDRPFLITKSNTLGEFSFNLPTTRAVTYRLFARSFYNGSPTPKSQTLTFYIAAFIIALLNNLLRLFLFFLIFLILSSPLLYMEYKTKKGRRYLAVFIEKKWRPFAIRTHLGLLRLWYSLRDWMHLHQK